MSAAPTVAPGPVKAGLDAMVATMDKSSLAAQGASIAAFAQHYQIRTIFMGLPYQDYHTELPNDDPATVAVLNQLFALASVYMIAGNSNWQLTPNVVPSEVKELVAVGARYPKFQGIVYDIEPQTLPDWKTKRQGVITQYVQFLKFLLVNPGGYAFKTTFVAVAPYFEYNLNSSGTPAPSLLQEVEGQPNVAGTYMLDYYAPPAAQMNEAAQQSLAELKKPFWWGSTTNAGDEPGISYYGTPAAAFIADMQQLRTLVLSRNGNLDGLFVNAWNSEDTSLQTVLPPP